MDILWIVLGIILILVGLVGCIVPGIPGPPLGYLSLLLLQLKEESPFSVKFLIVWAIIALMVTALDYIVPALGTKRFGGSRQGVWGAVIGIVVGIFVFPPFGIIIGPLIGALLGEYLAGKNSEAAMRSAFGTFIGFMSGVVLKLIVTAVMAWYFFANIV